MDQRVLIIDDEIDLMKIYQQLLEEEGFGVSIILAEEGMDPAQIDLDGYSIVLMDKLMPIDFKVILNRCNEKKLPYLIVTGGDPSNENEVNKLAVFGKLTQVVKQRLAK